MTNLLNPFRIKLLDIRNGQTFQLGLQLIPQPLKISECASP